MNRRKLAVVALAAVMALGLAGCNVEPGAAAFIGGTRITDKRIDSIANDLKPQPRLVGASRQEVFTFIVIGELSKRILDAQHVSVPVATAQELASQAGEQPDQIHALEAQYGPYIEMLQKSAPPAQPTGADQADLTKILTKLGANQAQAQQFLDSQMFRQKLGVRNALRDAMVKYHVSLSPRYGPAQFKVWTVQGVTLLDLDLIGVDNSGVTSHPTMEPFQPGQ